MERAWGRPRCAAAQGCPDTSPRKQSRTCALRSCPRSALGSQGDPRQPAAPRVSNSRAPCAQDASFPCPLCYSVVFKISLSLSFFFLVPLIQLEVRVNSYLSKGKQLGGGGRKEGRRVLSFNSPSVLISHKHLCPPSAKAKKCKCPAVVNHRDCPIWRACTRARMQVSLWPPPSREVPTPSPPPSPSSGHNQSTSHSHRFAITSHEMESLASPTPWPGLSETRSH